MLFALGDLAPRFTLIDENTRAVDLPEAGRLAVVVFYRGDW
jgi:peroxiredoxin